MLKQGFCDEDQPRLVAANPRLADRDQAIMLGKPTERRKVASTKRGSDQATLLPDIERENRSAFIFSITTTTKISWRTIALIALG